VAPAADARRAGLTARPDESRILVVAMVWIARFSARSPLRFRRCLLGAQPFGRALFLCMASAELYGQVPDIHVIPVGVPGPGSRYVVQVLRAGEGLTRRSGLLDRF
jgi:hypothetical protein